MLNAERLTLKAKTLHGTTCQVGFTLWHDGITVPT
jgi:hypothetical protein